MLAIERELGRARSGKGGRDFDEGHIGWIAFEHFTARPTVEIATTGADGEAYTELVTIRVAGDPHLHTHVAVPHCVLVDALQSGVEGRVGSLDLSRLQGRVHEFGGIYQAYLANNLRAIGIAVNMDATTGAARIVDVPEDVRVAFSKRTAKGEVAARAFAQAAGLDWGLLDSDRRIGLLKSGTQGDPRAPKHDDLSDFEQWHAQAERMRWAPASMIHLDAPIKANNEDGRLAYAYREAVTFLEKKIQGRALPQCED